MNVGDDIARQKRARSWTEYQTKTNKLIQLITNWKNQREKIVTQEIKNQITMKERKGELAIETFLSSISSTSSISSSSFSVHGLPPLLFDFNCRNGNFICSKSLQIDVIDVVGDFFRVECTCLIKSSILDAASAATLLISSDSPVYRYDKIFSIYSFFRPNSKFIQFKLPLKWLSGPSQNILWM